jgi:hypothetical protein
MKWSVRDALTIPIYFLNEWFPALFLRFIDD